MTHPTSGLSDGGFIKRALIVIGLGALVLFAWQMTDVLMLVFAAVLLAILLRGLADLVEAYTPLSGGLALGLSVLVLVIVLGGAISLFGTQISFQVGDLLTQLPQAWQSVRARIGEIAWLAPALQRIGDALMSGGSIVNRVSGVLSTALGVVTDVLLVIFGGLYIAAQPDLYQGGLVKLVPPPARRRIRTALRQCGVALRHWLVGQLVSMLLVGLLTGVGLWALSVPSALALGLFAGLAEFVPIVGPIVAAVPALLIALSQGTDLALWVLALFVVIQQLEGNLIQPLIQRRMVSLPPALTLFSVVAFGLLFGALGLLLAAPMTVTAFVLVRELYLREGLGETLREPAA
jgi:predicted PurR-regulated permease PerM